MIRSILDKDTNMYVFSKEKIENLEIINNFLPYRMTYEEI
jgi:hypothetical protein